MSVVARMYSQLRQLPIFRQMIDRSRWQLSYGQFAELGARRGKRGGTAHTIFMSRIWIQFSNYSQESYGGVSGGRDGICFM